MAEAREKEYRVFLFCIGLANESIALQRIERHAQAGGHDIDEALVRKRYRASLANLSKALPYCEEAHVLDNTVAFKRIALWHRNTLAWWGGHRSQWEHGFPKPSPTNRFGDDRSATYPRFRRTR